MESGPFGYPKVHLKERKGLKKLLLRALNRNQILILSEINGMGLTSLLKCLSETNGIPTSTLKLNAKVLAELGLIRSNKFYSLELTELGEFVFNTIKGD